MAVAEIGTFAAVAEIGTFAYVGFLVALVAYKTLRPQARRSRKLRKRIKAWTS